MVSFKPDPAQQTALIEWQGSDEDAKRELFLRTAQLVREAGAGPERLGELCQCTWQSFLIVTASSEWTVAEMRTWPSGKNAHRRAVAGRVKGDKVTVCLKHMAVASAKYWIAPRTDNSGSPDLRSWLVNFEAFLKISGLALPELITR